jgi:4'-phosphopantetheinyl transferase
VLTLEHSALPTAGEVHLWWGALDWADDGLVRAHECLDAVERARADRMTDPARRRFVAGRAMLRSVLGSYLDVDPAVVRVEAGQYGKPTSPSAPPALAFNFSSSAATALVGLTQGCRIGVDVESRPDGRWEELPVARYMSPEERAAVAELHPDERRRREAAAWVVKEAVAKAVGTGVSLPLTAIELNGEMSSPRIELKGAWRDHAEARWVAQLVADEPTRMAAVVLDGEWRTTVVRTAPAAETGVRTP